MEKFEYKVVVYDTKGFWGGSVETNSYQINHWAPPWEIFLMQPQQPLACLPPTHRPGSKGGNRSLGWSPDAHWVLLQGLATRLWGPGGNSGCAFAVTPAWE